MTSSDGTVAREIGPSYTIDIGSVTITLDASDIGKGLRADCPSPCCFQRKAGSDPRFKEDLCIKYATRRFFGSSDRRVDGAEKPSPQNTRRDPLPDREHRRSRGYLPRPHPWNGRQLLTLRRVQSVRRSRRSPVRV